MAAQSEHSIVALCEAFDVSRSGYYAHCRKQERPRTQQDEILKPLVKESFENSRQTYGSERIRRDLQEHGYRCGKNRIRRLMQEQQIRPRQKRRFRPRTTDSNHQNPVAPNWLAQIPAPDGPNQVWTTDITYIETREGWVYLAGVMDLYSRKIIGWHLSDTMTVDLVEKAVMQAIKCRQIRQGLIHHSDRGSQYTSNTYRGLLQQCLITPSMSRRGNCYDNAAQESFWATLKAECLGRIPPANLEEVERILFSYIEGFYNPSRRHSSLGYRSPQQFENAHYLRSLAESNATAFCGMSDAGEAPSLLFSSHLKNTPVPASFSAFGSVGHVPPTDRTQENFCGRLPEAPPEAPRRC